MLRAYRRKVSSSAIKTTNAIAPVPGGSTLMMQTPPNKIQEKLLQVVFPQTEETELPKQQSTRITSTN